MKGLVITTENKMQVREFGEPAYETIGKAVGGWIEVVHPKGLPDPFCMVVNEEGLLHGLPLTFSAWQCPESRNSPVGGGTGCTRTASRPS